MKRIIARILVFVMILSILPSNLTLVANAQEELNPVLVYDFEETLEGTSIADQSGNGYDGTLNGNATYATDSEKGRVLYMDGVTGSYAEFPADFFTGRNTMTISMDIKPVTVSGNFFTFAFGVSNTKYAFLRTRDAETRFAITTSAWNNEKEVKTTTSSVQDKWMNITLVMNTTTMQMYKDGLLVSTNNESLSVDDLGTDLVGYLGKSFYDDPYFAGYFDNVKVYDRALGEAEIATQHGLEVPHLKDVAADGMKLVTKNIDAETGNVTLYVSKNNTNSDFDYTSAPLTFTLTDGATITSEAKDTYDMTDSISIETKYEDKTKTWQIETVLCNNPLFGGEYADPDIDVFDGKYYIYPTTDGFSGWSGTKFNVFSSEDLVNWTDEGVILDLAADTEEEAGLNDNNIQIAPVTWSDGSAWAPTIEEKNGKYYFYFCGNDISTGSKAMGVAVADSPVGPFTVKDEPIVTMADCSSEGTSMGQAIDPSIFTEDDGTSYMLFGNGYGAIAKLTDDMMDYVPGTMENISGATDIREAITVTKRNGTYHFTWSCDDTGSENYSVNYGTSDTLYGPITYQYKVLQKDTSKDILGTGHHSILHIPGTDDYYIAYHRFVTPLGQYTSGYGFHRETCIDKVEFDQSTGLMKVITPTLEGITEPYTVPDVVTITIQYTSGTGGTIQGTATQTVAKGATTSQVTAVANTGYRFVKWNDGSTKASRTDTATADATYTAEFAQDTIEEKVTIQYKAGTGGTIRGTATQPVVKGTKTSMVTAVANTGYTFVKWSDGSTKAGRMDTATNNTTYTATFARAVTKVTLNKTKLTLGVKETCKLVATPQPSSAVSKKITYSSSKKSVATVGSSSGKITAKKAGKATITATAPSGVKATCTVTVRKAPSKITLNRSSKTLQRGKKFQIKVTLPKNTASNKITFSSNKKAVATVSSTGKVTAKKKGTATIIVKAFNGKKAKIKITVK